MAAAGISGGTRVPEGLRPGQISVVVLGRVIMGDVAVTLVDLAQRGLVGVSESSDSDTATADWIVTARSRPGSLLGYEQTLLDGLADYGEPSRLSVLAAEFSLVLSRVRTELIREAVRRGWLRHWHHGQRTPEGKEVARQLRAFRGELRRFKAERGEDALVRDWLPYALHFGLVSRDSPDQINLARFARSWVDAFSGLESWSRTGPRPRRPDEEILFPKDEWRGMSLELAAAWEMGL